MGGLVVGVEVKVAEDDTTALIPPSVVPPAPPEPARRLRMILQRKPQRDGFAALARRLAFGDQSLERFGIVRRHDPARVTRHHEQVDEFGPEPGEVAVALDWSIATLVDSCSSLMLRLTETVADRLASLTRRAICSLLSIMVRV